MRKALLDLLLSLARRSFTNLSSWLRELDKFTRPDVCKVLIGNKSDIHPQSAGDSKMQDASLYHEVRCSDRARHERFPTLELVPRR